MGHTISIRSAIVMVAQESGSLSPRVPSHSDEAAVSSTERCPEVKRIGFVIKEDYSRTKERQPRHQRITAKVDPDFQSP